MLEVVEQIPLTRLDNHDPELLGELLATVEQVASRAAFTGGAEVEAFEEEFAAYTGTTDAVGLSSGTEALHLGLRALGIGAGDEVVVPANSFIATAEAVTLAGARPVFADVDPETQLVTADTLAAAITQRTVALSPVHLFGRTLDMDPIVALARSRGLALIEDACQAHGAWYRGRRAGSFGDFAAFSFYPAKNLGAWGDAGGLTTSRAELADRVRLLRSHGERPRYHHRIPGTTARLDALQAAILRVKLPRLELWNAGRRRAAAKLRAALAETAVAVPAPVAPEGDHVFHQFVVRSAERDALRAHLDSRGIASGIHYPIPIHRSDAYAGEADDQAPVATRLASEILSLPLYPSLEDLTIERVAAAVAEFQP